MTTPDIEIHTFIKTTPNALWSALTDPEQLETFHYSGMKVEALKEGGQQLRRPDDGSPFIRERLISSADNRRLELTFEPVWAKAPDPLSTIVFEITPEPEACKLTFKQYNCLSFGIGDNWDRFLASLKSYLETGRGLRLPAQAARD